MVVRAPIAHNAHGADGEKDGKGLPDFVVQARFADFVQIDDVGLAQDG